MVDVSVTSFSEKLVTSKLETTSGSPDPGSPVATGRARGISQWISVENCGCLTQCGVNMAVTILSDGQVNKEDRRVSTSLEAVTSKDLKEIIMLYGQKS